MPFIALNKTTRQRIHAKEVSYNVSKEQKEQWICQVCEQPMNIRAGRYIIRHFYHLSTCTSKYSYHKESTEHLLGKEWIVEQLQHPYWSYKEAIIELEVRLPEIMRIADILVSFPDGQRIAHECQLSPIPLAELQQRSRDYLQADINVYWWMGEKASKVPGVLEWLLQTFGFYLTINFHPNTEEI